MSNSITYKNREIKNPYVIPCIHGRPGESGRIQAILEEYEISFLGNNYEGNLIASIKQLQNFGRKDWCFDGTFYNSIILKPNLS